MKCEYGNKNENEINGSITEVNINKINISENEISDAVDQNIIRICKAKVRIPKNVNQALESVYEKIYKMPETGTDTYEILMKDKALEGQNGMNKKRKSAGTNMIQLVRASFAIAACMLLLVSVIFREQIIKAAYEGYAYIYGHGEEKMEDGEEAYFYDGGDLVFGENGEITVKFIYWYKDELTIFARTLGTVGEQLQEHDIQTGWFPKWELYVNDDIDNSWCTGINAGGSSTSGIRGVIYKTGIKANGKITLTAYGDSYELELKKQGDSNDMPDIIKRSTTYGAIRLYPINSNQTVFIYEVECNMIPDTAKIGYGEYGFVELFNGSQRVSGRKYMVSDRVIIIDNDVNFDTIKFRSGHFMVEMPHIGNEDCVEFYLPYLKEGEKAEVNERIRIFDWEIEVEEVRKEKDEYIYTVNMGNFPYRPYTEGLKGEIEIALFGSRLTGRSQPEDVPDDNQRLEYHIGNDSYDSYDGNRLRMYVNLIDIDMEDIDIEVSRQASDFKEE